jgi:subtilase family serine protease
MKSLVIGALFTLGLAIGGPGTASSQAMVQRSGSVFHVAACSTHISLGMARCHAHIVTDSRGNAISAQISPSAVPAGYSPKDLRSAYKITANGSPSTAIAIVDAFGYPNAEADLAVYRKQYGLPPCSTANRCFVKYNQIGQKKNYPDIQVGWAQETALDLDMASAMCPNCKIILVEANTSSFGDLAAAVNEAAALGAHVISNSYGGGERFTNAFEPAYTHPGIAITASSGDEGYGVEFPAASPHVIATGGTSLYKDRKSPRGWSEAAWSGAGSGCSHFYPKPERQSDPLCSKRMVADVSAVADPSTGVAAYAPVSASSSEWLIFGGTSVAAPLIAGIIGSNGGEVSYQIPYGPSSQSWLNDVTTGANGGCGDTYFCTSGPGYDGSTGVGTPNTGRAF